MSTVSYLIIGLLAVFIIVAVIVAQPSISTISGIVMGGLTLVLIPFIIYFIRQVPKRDRNHEDGKR